MTIAIFTFGLPGAGKSTWIENNTKIVKAVISADKIKETLNPTDPSAHLKSTEMAEEMVMQCIKHGTPFLADGGGINNNYTYRQMLAAKKAGFKTFLIYFKTPLEVCLKRNSERKRDIPVPEEDIYKKAGMLNACLHRLVSISDEVKTINYFTHDHLFVDMDGTIAAYQHIPKDTAGAIDFINGQYYKHALPVRPMIDLLREDARNRKIYILSAAPDNLCIEEKKEWLRIHTDFLEPEDIYFIGNYRYKQIMINNLCKKYKIPINAVTIIDDKHSILEECGKMGMRGMHPSEYMSIGGINNIDKVIY